jgi:hypothetical protein
VIRDIAAVTQHQYLVITTTAALCAKCINALLGRHRFQRVWFVIVVIIRFNILILADARAAVPRCFDSFFVGQRHAVQVECAATMITKHEVATNLVTLTALLADEILRVQANFQLCVGTLAVI